MAGLVLAISPGVTHAAGVQFIVAGLGVGIIFGVFAALTRIGGR